MKLHDAEDMGGILSMTAPATVEINSRDLARDERGGIGDSLIGLLDLGARTLFPEPLAFFICHLMGVSKCYREIILYSRSRFESC